MDDYAKVLSDITYWFVTLDGANSAIESVEPEFLPDTPHTGRTRLADLCGAYGDRMTNDHEKRAWDDFETALSLFVDQIRYLIFKKNQATDEAVAQAALAAAQEALRIARFPKKQDGFGDKFLEQLRNQSAGSEALQKTIRKYYSQPPK